MASVYESVGARHDARHETNPCVNVLAALALEPLVTARGSASASLSAVAAPCGLPCVLSIPSRTTSTLGLPSLECAALRMAIE